MAETLCQLMHGAAVTKCLVEKAPGDETAGSLRASKGCLSTKLPLYHDLA